MKKISPPSDVTRDPRPVTDYKHWKASEFRSWLQHYSLPLLDGVLPNKYLRHWSLLTESLFLLLTDHISHGDVLRAETLIHEFVQNVERLYGIANCRYNIHILLHLPDAVKDWGPLWTTSTFLYEGFNQKILGMFRGTNLVSFFLPFQL